MIIHKNSKLGKFLLFFPLWMIPFWRCPARLGMDVENYFEIKWKWGKN